jgi:hypothetical protein
MSRHFGRKALGQINHMFVNRLLAIDSTNRHKPASTAASSASHQVCHSFLKCSFFLAMLTVLESVVIILIAVEYSGIG